MGENEIGEKGEKKEPKMKWKVRPRDENANWRKDELIEERLEHETALNQMKALFPPLEVIKAKPLEEMISSQSEVVKKPLGRLPLFRPSPTESALSKVDNIEEPEPPRTMIAILPKEERDRFDRLEKELKRVTDLIDDTRYMIEKDHRENVQKVFEGWCEKYRDDGYCKLLAKGRR